MQITKKMIPIDKFIAKLLNDYYFNISALKCLLSTMFWFLSRNFGGDVMTSSEFGSHIQFLVSKKSTLKVERK